MIDEIDQIRDAIEPVDNTEKNQNQHKAIADYLDSELKNRSQIITVPELLMLVTAVGLLAGAVT